jgi:hypothetical protein
MHAGHWKSEAGRRLKVRGRATFALVLLAAAMLMAPAHAAGGEELRVDVSPARAHAAPDGSAEFAAAVYGSDGDEVDAVITWSVLPPSMGKIGADGLFEAAGVPGRAIVRAAAAHGAATGTGHAVVEVGSQPPSRLAVSVDPSRAVLAPGEQTGFEASVTDPLTGDEVDAEISWVVIPERLGSIDESGVFVAGPDEASGRVAARATYDGREGVGDAGIVIGSPPGPGIQITVVPGRALLRPGEESEFEAVVTDAAGNPVDADVEWSALPTRLGVVDASGLFTAGPDIGAGRLVATVPTTEGPARGFAGIEIRHAGPAGVRVRIRPSEAGVVPGGDVQFEAVVVGPGGDPLDVPVQWSVRPSWIGTIDADGLFIASEEMEEPAANGGWIGAVTASIETNEGTASDAARVMVRDPGSTLRVRIHPHRPVLAPGEQLQFEARVIGTGEPSDWTTEWAVFPGDLGTITPDGLLTANPAFGDPASGEFGPHEGVVGAQITLPDGSVLADRAHVRITTPGQPVRVHVTPSFAIVPPGESVAFEAVVFGPDGDAVEIPVVWRVTPAHIGTISSDGVFTASDLAIEPNSWQRPRGQVVAEVRAAGGQTFRGAAVVVIDLPNPEATVRISPKSVEVHEGESSQFHADARLADGTPVEIAFEWRVTDPALGDVTQDGVFTATETVPPGQSRRTTVVVGGMYGGRLYWDFATVRVTR